MRNKELANRIKLIRLSKGLSQEQFGELFSPVAARSIVSRWESGNSVPNAERLKKIASLGGISVEELINGSIDDLIEKVSDYIYLMYCEHFDGYDFPITKIGKEIWSKLNFHKDTSEYKDQRLVAAFDIIFVINADNYNVHSDEVNKNYKLNMKKGLDYCSDRVALEFKGSSVTNLSVERILAHFKFAADDHFYGYTPTNEGLVTVLRDEINEGSLKIDSIANVDVDPSLSSVPKINKSFYKELKELINNTNDKLTELYNKYI